METHLWKLNYGNLPMETYLWKQAVVATAEAGSTGCLIFVSPTMSRLSPTTPVHLSPMHRCILYLPLAETGDEQVIRSETSWNSKRKG